MKRTNWIAGIFLSLLLIGGFALDVSAQQPAAPPAPAPAESTQTPTQQAPAPQGDSSAQPAQPAQPPSSNNTQIETRTERTERVVERPGTFLGVDATVAMVIGAVLVIVVVIGLVAMSRRGDGVRETHETTHTRHHV
jgi:hypothetical protein